MFVKIVRGLDDRSGQRATSVYECMRYYINPVKGKPTEFTISMEGKPGGDSVAVCASYDTKEPDVQVYVMNENGRTVETIFRTPPPGFNSGE